MYWLVAPADLMALIAAWFSWATRLASSVLYSLFVSKITFEFWANRAAMVFQNAAKSEVLVITLP